MKIVNIELPGTLGVVLVSYDEEVDRLVIEVPSVLSKVEIKRNDKHVQGQIKKVLQRSLDDLDIKSVNSINSES